MSPDRAASRACRAIAPRRRGRSCRGRRARLAPAERTTSSNERRMGGCLRAWRLERCGMKRTMLVPRARAGQSGAYSSNVSVSEIGMGCRAPGTCTSDEVAVSPASGTEPWTAKSGSDGYARSPRMSASVPNATFFPPPPRSPTQTTPRAAPARSIAGAILGRPVAESKALNPKTTFTPRATAPRMLSARCSSNGLSCARVTSKTTTRAP